MRYDMTAMGLAQVGSSIALDVVVLCFPLPIVFSWLLSARKKCMVFLMFWLGALSVTLNNTPHTPVTLAADITLAAAASPQSSAWFFSKRLSRDL